MISSRLTNKPSRKERPKSSEKGAKGARKSRDAGTPEKNGSPVVFGMDDSEVESPATVLQIPTDLDLQQFAINEEDMRSKRQPHPPAVEKPTKKVLVRKNCEEDVWIDNTRKRRILVAKKTSPRTETEDSKEEEKTHSEIKDEPVKPHTILGSMHDYRDEILRRGLPINAESFYGTKICPVLSSAPGQRLDTPKEELLRDDNMNEVRALENWDKRMKERRKQQAYLAGITKKQPDDLLMNTCDTFRQIQQEREVIDRAIPSIDYGKGYRVGSEFWKQVEKIGGDERGISVTLTKTERGMPPPVEHIGKPATIIEETNEMAQSLQHIPAYYPWWKSSYLQSRKDQLKEAVDGLVPHKPYMNELEVIGRSIKGYEPAFPVEGESLTPGNDFPSKAYQNGELSEDNDPFSAYADVVPLPVFGPSLVMNGQALQWTGSDIENRGETGPVVRLLFLSPIDGNSLNALDITNDGTAAIYYSWRLLRPQDPFGLKRGRAIQRFYFDIRSGVILPGDNLKVRFSFKSPNAGIFNETWVFETQPILCGGAQVQVALKGIATREDTHVEQRMQLEKELALREAQRAVDRILNDILAGVRTPPRPSTPEDAYITDKEIFERMNEKFEYDSETIAQLSALYAEVTSGKLWNLSLRDITQAIKTMEDEEQMEATFEVFNSILEKMTKQRVLAAERLVYSTSYQLLCEAIDCFCEEATALQNNLGMPERELVVEQPQEEVTKKGKRLGDRTPDKRQDAKKDKRDAMSPSKAKSAGSSKTRSKDSMVTKSEHQESESKVEEVEEIQEDPAAGKYKEKLYTMLYGILSETIEKMESLALASPDVAVSGPSPV